MKSWQIPVSLQGHVASARAHWFAAGGKTHILVKAACGRKFNPGFARKAKRGMYRCSVCRETIRRGGA